MWPQGEESCPYGTGLCSAFGQEILVGAGSGAVAGWHCQLLFDQGPGDLDSSGCVFLSLLTWLAQRCALNVLALAGRSYSGSGAQCFCGGVSLPLPLLGPSAFQGRGSLFRSCARQVAAASTGHGISSSLQKGLFWWLVASLSGSLSHQAHSGAAGRSSNTPD